MISRSKTIPIAYPVLGDNTAKYVNECIESTWISSIGHYITDFEKSFADFIGVKHVIACNNGTTSLHLALAALGVGPGDEVIVPDLTYIASANCVAYCGARPVFVDNDPCTFNIDPERIEAAITPRTKAIMPVHLYGHPCDMDPIRAIARRYGLKIVEDAAEAHGAHYKNEKVGALGDCASFSFFGNKIITTGEGGAVTTNDDALAERLRLLRNQGMDPNRRYWFNVVGYNYRMTNVTAAIGLAQMERIDQALAFRRRLAGLYDEALASFEDVMQPFVAPWATHSYWMYTIKLSAKAKISRDVFMASLAEDGVETRPVFFPMHVLPPYAQDGRDFPNAAACGAQGVNLPTHEKMSDEDVDYVARAVSRALT